MAFDRDFADRVKTQIEKKTDVLEKKMFGGLCFMVDDKMCMGVMVDDLMCRIDPETYDDALEKPGAKTMDFTGKIMKGFVLVEAEALKNKKDLDYWIDLCLAYNPKANRSKKRKPK